MTKHEYVQLLKYMLKQAEKDKKDVCIYCPIEYISMVFTNGLSSGQLNIDNVCNLCQKFVGLARRSDPPMWPSPDTPNINPKCPCARPGKTGAVARAWKHIEAYEEKYN